MEKTTKKEYRLENLSCANCAMKFENNIKNLPNVEEAMLISVHLKLQLLAMLL